MQSIEDKVDLLVDPPKAEKTKRTRRYARLIGAGGGLGVVWKLLAVGVVVGSLIGLAFEFNIIQTTTIPTQG